VVYWPMLRWLKSASRWAIFAWWDSYVGCGGEAPIDGSRGAEVKPVTRQRLLSVQV
jgi:hypothetical protein